MHPCLTLSIIRYGSRVKRGNLGKGVAPSLTPCSSYRKGNLRVTLDYGRQLYFYLFILIIYLKWLEIFIHLFIHLMAMNYIIYLVIHLFIHLFVYLIIYLLMNYNIYLFIHY